MSQVFLDGAKQQEAAGRETDVQEFPPESEKQHFYCMGDRAQEQIDQKGCGLSLEV